MPLDIVAILTPNAGKEDRLEELLINLAASVQKSEPDVARYVATKVIGREGTPEFVVIERYKDKATLDAHQQMDYFQDLIKFAQDEDLLAKPLNVLTLQPIGGFDNR